MQTIFLLEAHPCWLTELAVLAVTLKVWHRFASQLHFHMYLHSILGCSRFKPGGAPCGVWVPLNGAQMLVHT